MRVPFVNLELMHKPLHNEMLAAVEQVLSKGNFILGDEVKSFEKSFAEYIGVKHAIGVSSGLAALELALKAYDIGPGDEVIVPANTFIATAAAVSFVGAIPVLVEPEAGTFNLDPDRIEEAITHRTKAIMPVHLYGIPAKMDEIMASAERHNLIVIEDASQAHGASYHGQRVGSIGNIAGFSLYPAKNLGAMGDAGVITTNDDNVVAKIQAMRNCGQVNKYEHVYAPHNYRLDTLDAAVLDIKLRQLDTWNSQRQEAAQWYTELLQDTMLITPKVPENSEAVWHLYVVRTTERDALQQYLAQNEIAASIHYPVPIHQTAYYANAPHITGELPITESEAGEILSLPLFPGISREQVQHVADCIKAFEAESMVHEKI